MTDFGLFLGRFHPVVVHLPIGFFLLAVIMEWMKKGTEDGVWQQAIRLGWLTGAITATIAAFVGWLLANHGTYFETDLFLHRWFGIGIAVIGWIVWWGKSKMKNTHFLQSKWMPIAMAGLLLVTGHLGGNLTHGRGYLLEYAPFVGGGVAEDTLQSNFANLDSIVVYRDLIRPVFEQKCFDCHSEDQARGGLIMDNEEGLLEGGDHGEVFVAGKAYESELVNRVTLPRNDRLFMPPKGTPMSYQEIRLMEWWVNEGAAFDKHLKESTVPTPIQVLLLREYGIDLEPKPLVETIKVAAADPAVLTKLSEGGYRVNSLAQTNNLLEVKFKGKVIDQSQLQTLLDTKDQITWLDLGKMEVNDAMLEVIGQLPNLTRLRLEQNPITDAGVKFLEGLKNLESLNLYGTEISDAALASIAKMPSLKRVYFWQTGVTAEGVEALLKDKPELEADLGFNFDAPNDAQ